MDHDPSHAERILGPYPELLTHWRGQMEDVDPTERYGVGGVNRMYSETYLREVVRQHHWILDNPNDNAEPGLLAEIEQIVAQDAGFKARRESWLADPFWRAMVRSRNIAEQYDPDYMRRSIEPWVNPPDPFSEEQLQLQAFVDAVAAGAEVTMTEIATGEVVDRFKARPDKARSAPTN